MKPEVEKVELELFRAGQFEDKDDDVEDASAPAAAPPAEPPKVVNYIDELLEKRKLSRSPFSWKIKKFLKLPSIYLCVGKRSFCRRRGNRRGTSDSVHEQHYAGSSFTFLDDKLRATDKVSKF